MAGRREIRPGGVQVRVKELVDRIVADGVITIEERAELVQAICEDPELSAEEREQVERVKGMIERGEVRLEGRSEG